MAMEFPIMDALEVLERERGVPADVILEALANALVSAYKRRPGAAEEARVTIDADSGEIRVYAQELDEDGTVVNEWEDTPEDFGRIAAQTAKQVIQQRMRDVKREQVFDSYEGREGDLITGIVQQVDHRFAILDLGDAEAILPKSEGIPYERLDRGNRVKAIIIEVRGEGKGPQIVVSRSHPDLVRRLLELEVPELTDGTVELVSIAREPGNRTKIAVVSNDPAVDPKGACVGARGSRVRQVVNELKGEKVDVVQWREDVAQFIAEALGPAKVKEVRINEDEKVAEVIVSEHQLSLAIGKEGQNARLAARLSGYKVDIRSDAPPPAPEAPQSETATTEEATTEATAETVAAEEAAVGADEPATTEDEPVADVEQMAVAEPTTAEDPVTELEPTTEEAITGDDQTGADEPETEIAPTAAAEAATEDQQTTAEEPLTEFTPATEAVRSDDEDAVPDDSNDEESE